MLSALAEGTSEISGYLASQDCQQTIKAFQAMGISISASTIKGRPCLSIEGKGLEGLTEPRDVLDCGNSGTTMRLLTGLLSGQPFFSVLTGDQSLRTRPMRRIVDPLRMRGADIAGRAEGAQAPLAIVGKRLSAIDYLMPIASAQVKSAILLSGLGSAEATLLREPKASRDHTERMFQEFGLNLEKKKEILTFIGGQPFQAKKIAVPGDLSSASFFLVAGTLIEGSDITLENVGVNPTRTGILDILEQMGAKITLNPKPDAGHEPLADLQVCAHPLRGIEIEGDLILRAIDEFPIVCVAAARAEGRTTIRGAKELRFKESDRIETMAEALRGMGVAVETFPDGIQIEGKTNWKGCTCITGGDHRVAMSMAIAGLLASGGNKIDDVACIDTSYPGFFKDLSKLAEA